MKSKQKQLSEQTTSEPLTAAERQDLEAREAAIRKEAGGSQLKIGQELWAISKAKYHRKLGHKTIEAYALKTFGNVVGTSKSHVMRLLCLAKGAEVIQKSPIGDTIDLRRESPVRELVAHHAKPYFPKLVQVFAAHVAANDKPLSASKCTQIVTAFVQKERANEHKLVPEISERLPDIHVSKIEDGLPFVKDGEIDLTFTSFRYNVGIKYKSYGETICDDSQSLTDLCRHYTSCIKAIDRVTNSNHGRVAINLADVYNIKPDADGDRVIYLDQEIDNIVRQYTSWRRYCRIYWDKGDIGNKSKKSGSVGSYSCPAIIRRAEVILVYYKGNMSRQNDPDRRSIDSKTYFDLQQNIWRISSRHRKDHPCAFPLELAENVIKLFSAGISSNGKQDAILDPLGGSGTTALAALNLGRRFVYNDASAEYADGANKRLLAAIKKAKQEIL